MAMFTSVVAALLVLLLERPVGRCDAAVQVLSMLRVDAARHAHAGPAGRGPDGLSPPKN